MALTPLSADLEIIQKLQDRPNANEGLTAEQLKAKFDEGSITIQEYINGVLLLELPVEFATKAELAGLVLGQIPDGSLTFAKLAVDAIASQSQAVDGTAGNVLMTPQRTVEAIEARTYYGVTTGTGTAYGLTLSPAPTALTAGFMVRIKPHTNNTGAATLNVNGLGAVSLKKADGSEFSADSLLATGIYTFVYDGTAFISQGEGGVAVKSIQSGQFHPGSGISFEQTISPVDLSKSIVALDGIYTSTANPSNVLFKAELTANNKITFTKGVSSFVSAPIRWRVIEFAGIKSIQHGVTSLSGSSPSANAAISTVNNSKCMIYFSFSTDSTSTTAGVIPAMMSVAINFNGTSIVLEHTSGYGTKSVSWYIVEYP